MVYLPEAGCMHRALAIGGEIDQGAAQVTRLAAKSGQSVRANELHVHVRDAAGKLSKLGEKLVQGILVKTELFTQHRTTNSTGVGVEYLYIQ